MYVTIEREYPIRTGLLTIKLFLNIPGYTQSSVTMDIIRDIELNYGYEDQEDLLLFYPNTTKLVFDDIDRKNYNVLKSSLSGYDNSLPPGKHRSSGLEVYLNGVRKFSGYIDPYTLSYSVPNRAVSFEAVCYTSQLKNLKVDRNDYVNLSGFVIPENSSVSFLLILYSIFWKVWPDFIWNLYDISQINSIQSGVFCKHDWMLHGQAVFPAADAYADWSQTHSGNGKQGLFGTFMNYDSTKFFGEDRVCDTYSDMLRILALQFGATIGVEDINKVFFIKRFGISPSVCLDISDNCLELTKTLHLDSVRGVEVINDWNGLRYFEYGDLERTSSGEFKYPDKILQPMTYVGSYQDENESGTCIYIHDGTRLYPVYGRCWDPLLGSETSASAFHELVGKWTRESRKTPKERIEAKLVGIDYSMSRFYSISPDNFSYNSVFFRPMQMTKNLMKNTTQITGLQI